VVRYRITNFNEKGEISDEPPIEIQDDYYTPTKKITKVIKGYFKNIADYHLLIDLEKKSRFEVWQNEGKIKDIGAEPYHHVNYTVEKTNTKEKILNHNCTLYKVKRKERLANDTLYMDLYTADNLEIENLNSIVELQGNLSTWHVNGEVAGLPLKIITRIKNLKIEILAVKIEEGKVLASLDDYFMSIRVKK
jgi:hypothetical protein